MVDAPWRTDGPLNYGMVAQRLRGLGCTEVGHPTEGSVTWRSPTGFVFSMSKADIDADTLNEIVTKVISTDSSQ